MKNLSVKVQLKDGAQTIQQKGRPIPIHLQDQVALELRRLIKHGYLERATEDCFVSPAVITVKKDKSIKIALDSRKLNQDKLEAITKIKIPKNEKELKSFLGAIQYLSKYIENLSANTDVMRKLLKEQNEWIGQTNIQKHSTN